jgi:4-amino-4-deoxy-L-arabinose transferase-like glycosyltransferase
MGALIRQSSAICLGVLAAFVLFGLVGHDPWKPDEAYTFGLVWHIVEKGAWLVPTLGGEPFVEKPPLFFWTAALFVKALGWALAPHDAARLASGFYVGLTLWLTWLASGKRIAAPLLLAGSLGYLQHAHQLITDNSLIAGIALGLYALTLGRPLASGLLLGTGAGVAFLSKGLLGPGMLGLIAVALPVFPSWRTAAHLQRLLWAAVALAPWALIWPSLLYAHSKPLFDEWFWVNNFGRFTGSAGLGGVLDHSLYVKNLAWFALPAWPLAAWLLFSQGRAALSRTEVQLPLVAFVVMLLVLSAASSARTVYALPMLVPLALLAAPALDTAPRWLLRPLEVLGTWGAALVAALLWAGWLALLIAPPAWMLKASPGFVPHPGGIALLFAVLASAGWAYLVLTTRALAVTWTAGITFAWALAMTLWLPYLDHPKTYRGVAEEIKAKLPASGCVASRNLTEPQRAMFHYFAGVVSLREASSAAASCPALLVHSSTPAEPPHGGEWQLAWRGTRPGDDTEYFWLYSRKGP